MLETIRLIIRDPLPTDINDWHRLMSDPKTMYYLSDIMTHSLEESRQNLEIAIAEASNPNRTKYFLAIEDKMTGAFIGTTGYTVTQTTPVGKSVGVGYFILPEYHGREYMTEALREVIRFAFEDDGVYRIEVGCLAEYHASERVMQKCGFIKEAERKAHTWHDGHLKDRVEYRLLRDEWPRVLFPEELPESPQFVVIAAQHNGKWLYVRHKERDTYEIPGGHIEPGETPLEAARRELYEESGAADYTLDIVCPYGVERGNIKTYGLLYFARVERFDDLPDYEIAERVLVENMPGRLTYPHIQPLLMKKVQEWLEGNMLCQ